MTRFRALLLAVAGLLGLSGCMSPRVSGFAPDTPGLELARAILRLSTSGLIGEPAAVEHALGLPGLAAGIRWRENGKLARRVTLEAQWTPPEEGANFGIKSVLLSKFPFDALGRPEQVSSLTLSLQADHCPALEVLEAVFKQRLQTTKSLSPSGDYSTTRSFTLPAAPQASASVVLNAPSGTCRLTLFERRPRE